MARKKTTQAKSKTADAPPPKHRHKYDGPEVDGRPTCSCGRKKSGIRPGEGKKPEGSGRKPGTSNKVTVEARAFAREIVDDPDYRKSVRDRAIKGELAPAVEKMVWHYAYGRPPQEVNITGNVTFTKIAEQAAARRAALPEDPAVAAAIEQARRERALKSAIKDE